MDQRERDFIDREAVGFSVTFLSRREEVEQLSGVERDTEVLTEFFHNGCGRLGGDTFLTRYWCLAVLEAVSLS